MEKQGLNCATILIVEDDKDLRVLISEFLEAEGYSVKQASNGKEALELLEKIPKPCLVLLDMMMPIMDGRAFLDRVMVSAALAPIPVLIVSAMAGKIDSKGAIGFMKKPIDTDALLNIVKEYCKF